MLDEVEQQICGRARLQEPIPGKTKRAKLKPGQEEGREERQSSESGVNKQPDRSSKTKIKSQPRLAKNRALLTLKRGDPGRLWRRCSVYSCRKSFFGGRKKQLMSVCFMVVVFLRVSSSLCFPHERQTQAASLTQVRCQSAPLPFFFSFTFSTKEFNEHEHAV